MHLSNLKIRNFRCYGADDKSASIDFRPGLSAIIGSNDGGKTAIVDALRFALGTSDQDRIWLDDSDFHDASGDMSITCTFTELSEPDVSTFLEYLTYGVSSDGKPSLIVNWTAELTGQTRNGRPYRRVEVRTGGEGGGKVMAAEDRFLLQATYLRPLRNAEEALSAGRGSRLAQVLQQSKEIKQGSDVYDPSKTIGEQKLSVLGIANLLNKLLGDQVGVDSTRSAIDTHLTSLALKSENLISAILVNGDKANDEARLREILEKLDLKLKGDGKLGLGSDNLLFMACELILLSREEEGVKLLIIEEPEAHLHAQRQLQVMRYLKAQADEKGIQIIITTHSPNLASVIDLENLILIKRFTAFGLAEGQTLLSQNDYKFLKRFLDVTKANLFFAHGVLIVEGDAENILIPTIATLLGCDLTEHGVSIVNVGGVGLGRYARIFQRKAPIVGKEMGLRVACLRDLDVMPNCGPIFAEKVNVGELWPASRRWEVKSDYADDAALEARRLERCAEWDGQGVKTFISDNWTFEYDLALGPKDGSNLYSGGLGKYVYVAVCLSDNDDKISSGKKTVSEVSADALMRFGELSAQAKAEHGSVVEEVIASKIYSPFVTQKVSKPIAAQYLSALLIEAVKKGEISAGQLRTMLPQYIVQAIEYVTNVPSSVAQPAQPVPANGGS